jgi:hypothetical protein
MSPDGLVAAAVVGLETVEVLHLNDEPAPIPVIAPAISSTCRRMPVAAVPGDYGDTGIVDLWVQEPCGGNWIGRGPTFTNSAPSVDRLPPDPGPRPYADYFDAVDGPIVVGGTPGSFFLSQRVAGSWTDAKWFDVSDPVAVPVTNVWAAIDLTHSVSAEDRLLVQGSEALYVVASDNSELTVVRTLKQKVLPPYLRPFAGYDHLTILDPAVCPDTALGIGLFSSESTGNPRRIQIIGTADETYAVIEPTMLLDEVTTFSILPLEHGPLLLGALGKRGARNTFVLDALDGCSRMTALAELDVSFELKTPPLPAGYEDEFVPLTNAVTLVPFFKDGVAHFAHYDGYTVRTIDAEQHGAAWTLEERQHEVHAERSDSSFD